MIITVTCNPAIDKTIYEDNTSSINIGGKGINVSKSLYNVGIKSILTGFIGKDNKDIVLNDLKEFDHQFIEVDGQVRTNTKKIINNNLYEENMNGPFINNDCLNKLKEYLSQFKDEIIIISGSISKNVSKDYYGLLVKTLKNNNNYVILDADNEYLVNAIKYKPNLIKPNKDEVCRLFNIEYNENIVIDKCQELIHDGIENIIISLGEEGALFISKDRIYKCESLNVNYVSALGAGDSMIAGYVYGKVNSMNYEECIKYAMAFASSAVEQDTSYIKDLSRINTLVNSVIMKRN